jgi:hypothetical protein
MKSNLLEFIKKTLSDQKSQRTEYPFGQGYAFVKDPLPENVDIEHVLNTVSEIIPPHLLELIESVLVGEFEEFENRQINAMYKDGAIYITNAQTDNDDMIDDLVHELAHAVEKEYGYEIYALDTKLANEFKCKRDQLKNILNSHDHTTQGYDFGDIEYNLEFDDYLFREIGYPVLSSLVVGLFVDAYSCTSIGEYFASGFEAYFLRDGDYLKKISPVLYRKIKEITSDA